MEYKTILIRKKEMIVMHKIWTYIIKKITKIYFNIIERMPMDDPMELEEIAELEEEVSEFQYSAKDDGRHSFAKDGGDYYKTKFEVEGKSFEGLINIAKNGEKKTLYDITKIKEMSPYSTSDKSFSASVRPSLNNTSILPTKENVNSNTTEYSMQKKSKKYTRN